MSTAANLLKRLIIEKYGEEKFFTGIELTHAWLVNTANLDMSFNSFKKQVERDITPFFTRPIKVAIEKLFAKNYDP